MFGVRHDSTCISSRLLWARLLGDLINHNHTLSEKNRYLK
jgi:hypothetical protein